MKCVRTALFACAGALTLCTAQPASADFIGGRGRPTPPARIVLDRDVEVPILSVEKELVASNPKSGQLETLAGDPVDEVLDKVSKLTDVRPYGKVFTRSSMYVRHTAASPRNGQQRSAELGARAEAGVEASVRRKKATLIAFEPSIVAVARYNNVAPLLNRHAAGAHVKIDVYDTEGNPTDLGKTLDSEASYNETVAFSLPLQQSVPLDIRLGPLELAVTVEASGGLDGVVTARATPTAADVSAQLTPRFETSVTAKGEVEIIPELDVGVTTVDPTKLKFDANAELVVLDSNAKLEANARFGADLVGPLKMRYAMCASANGPALDRDGGDVRSAVKALAPNALSFASASSMTLSSFIPEDQLRPLTNFLSDLIAIPVVSTPGVKLDESYPLPPQCFTIL